MMELREKVENLIYKAVECNYIQARALASAILAIFAEERAALEAEVKALNDNEYTIRREHGWKRDGRELPECVRERIDAYESREAKLREALEWMMATRRRVDSEAWVEAEKMARAALATGKVVPRD